ncbi:MAG: hypothetical protein Q8Q01_03935 [archaeon]|nr:hypothetical protein [archaeon]
MSIKTAFLAIFLTSCGGYQSRINCDTQFLNERVVCEDTLAKAEVVCRDKEQENQHLLRQYFVEHLLLCRSSSNQTDCKRKLFQDIEDGEKLIEELYQNCLTKVQAENFKCQNKATENYKLCISSSL